jgi:hypothetical protein
MALDDRGNARVDFVYGNVPMQPNFDLDVQNEYREGRWIAPGDGEGEYYVDGHATASEWGQPDYFPLDHLKPSQYLDGSDSHNIDLREWNGFPASNPNTGFNNEVNWWDVTPAMQMPNLYGKTVEDALASYRNLGVAENFLGDWLTDATNPYDSGNWLRNSGVVIWRYLAPDYQIGTHWDGSPWLASEVDGKIAYVNENPGYSVAVGSYNSSDITTSDPTDPTLYAPWWLSICAIQTTDPTKNSWDWWN